MMFAKYSLLLLALTLVASPLRADETGNANVELCKRFYAEVNAGNTVSFDEFLSADFVEHEAFPGFETNREGTKKFFTMLRTAFPDLTFEVEFYVADADKVVAYLTVKGTHEGEFMGFEPTGKDISVRVVDIMRVEDGKVVEHWGVTDSMAMMEQLSPTE